MALSCSLVINQRRLSNRAANQRLNSTAYCLVATRAHCFGDYTLPAWIPNCVQLITRVSSIVRTTIRWLILLDGWCRARYKFPCVHWWSNYHNHPNMPREHNICLTSFTVLFYPIFTQSSRSGRRTTLWTLLHIRRARRRSQCPGYQSGRSYFVEWMWVNYSQS